MLKSALQVKIKYNVIKKKRSLTLVTHNIKFEKSDYQVCYVEKKKENKTKEKDASYLVIKVVKL